ncbi:WTAP [Cordylochernes scorpioides]|uniref:WTAP n=1 Tax=Cordylochernes scorpioides TaxID=51811 RepID=A0ABY6JYE4_9ARAC|nr:WTAP [Cordylochernes scorpioides]
MLQLLNLDSSSGHTFSKLCGLSSSNTGKRLMLKCRKLHQENEELGKLVTSGRVAKLESELALQKNFSQEIKQSQAEMDDVLVQMEENAELMQNTIQALQNRLKESKKELEEQKAENARLKEQVSSLQEQLANQCKEENGGQVNHRTPQTPPPPVKEEDEKPPSPPSANDELQKLPSKVRTRHKTSPSVEGNGDSTSPPPTAKNCLKWSSANSNGGTTPAKKTPKIKRTSSRNPTVTTAIKKANCDPARTNDGSSPKRFKKEDEVSPTEVQVAKTLANWANGEVEH